jgi:aromatic-L-amino-acid decarboxylase
MASNDHELELSPATMRRMIEAAAERVVEHISALPEQPAIAVEGGAELSRALAADPPPEEPTPYGELLDLLFERVIPTSYNTAGPGYLAYIPGGGLYHAAVADYIADAVNRYSGVWLPAPGVVQLEVNVVRWFCRIVGYPEEALGFLTTGGSLATWTGLVTARRERLPDDFLDGTIYAGDQVHHAVVKSAVLAGFPAANVRLVPSDERFRIRPDALATAICDDRAAGKTPFLVVGSAGTTNTGAVDDLEALADLAAEEKLWFHVDAAYGGFFVLTERGRQRFRGLERADSLVLDPHKGMFLPYGTGCLLVRDGAALHRTHAIAADYMPQFQSDPDLVDFCEISPELSRDWRGLRVWLPLKMHGLGAFRRALDEKLDLAERACEELEKLDGIEIVARPQLSIVGFRLAPPGLGLEATNRLNREFLDRINAQRRVFLTATTIGGRFILRICVLSFRTHRERMEACLEDIRRARREVLTSSGVAST